MDPPRPHTFIDAVKSRLSRRMVVRFIKSVLFAGLFVGIATAAKFAVGEIVTTDADALFLVAVAVAAWRVDAASGLAAVALAGFAQVYWFMEPRFSFAVAHTSDLSGLASWTLEGSIVCLLVAALNAKRITADASSKVDRTETLQTKQALADSERAYQLMFDASPVAMYVFDPTTLRLTGVNNAALTLYNYSREAFLQLDLTLLKRLEDREPTRIALKTDAGGDFRGAVIHQRSDGSTLAIDVMSRAITLRGKLARMCVVVDRTQEQKLEGQLRQAQKMDAVGRLAGGVAHDFNNMLSVILGFTWSLLEDAPPESESHAPLTEIMRAGERAADLTRQLLAFSRQSPQRTKVVDLNLIVETSRTLIGRLVGEHIEIVSHLAKTKCTSDVDAAQIEQVIMNLAVNARDAMPSGGKLTIETSIVDCDADLASRHPGMVVGRHVMLAVSDGGVGMDAVTAAQIFEPFFTTKPSGKGTGLGLAIVFGVVKQHGGHISVYSEPGHGTTFKIFFPFVEQDKVSAPPPRTSVAPDGRETILVVEDEEQVLTLVIAILQRRGYRVLAAHTPDDALAVCAAYCGEIDLLLTDVIMPQMTGKELADRIVAARPTIKVLYTSGYTDNVVLDHGLTAGASFLQKPVMPEVLSRTVRELLKDRSPVAA